MILRVRYPNGYHRSMDVHWPRVLAGVRVQVGLTQQELAERAGTSRPTLSAYEHGRKAPGVDTYERILAAAGYRFEAVPAVRWSEIAVGHGRTCFVPDRLWRLPVEEAVAEVELPLESNWSDPGRRFRLRDRRERGRLYEIVLREGLPADLERWVDGALLVDLWRELVVPRLVRAAWTPVVAALLGGETAAPSRVGVQ